MKVLYHYHYNYTINKLQKTRVLPCPSENDFWFFYRTCKTVNVSDGKVYRIFKIFDFKYPYTIYNFLTVYFILKIWLEII